VADGFAEQHSQLTISVSGTSPSEAVDPA